MKLAISENIATILPGFAHLQITQMTKHSSENISQLTRCQQGDPATNSDENCFK